MRFRLLLLILFPANFMAQPWRDSLQVAREAYKNKNYEKALAYYRSAQNNAPEGVDLTKEIAQATYRSQDYKNSDTYYQQSIQTTTSPEEKSKLQHNLGNVRMKQKDYAGAIEAYKDALRNNPGDEQTRYNLSEAIRQKKEQDQKQQQPQNNQNNSQNQQNNSSNDTSSKNYTPQMPNKQADKMLDDLAKKEAATRRKRGNQEQGDKKNVKSGRNW
jgi:Ca-activated chloride channel homolog